MTTTLREAAAEFIEQGRALGRVEALETIVLRIRDVTGLPETQLRQRLEGLCEDLGHRAAAHKALASGARSRADALLRAVEHPGARLGLRVLAAARAARKAWREFG